MHLFYVALQSLVTWRGDMLVCTQEGEKANRGWRHWIEGDRLYLVGLTTRLHRYVKCVINTGEML